MPRPSYNPPPMPERIAGRLRRDAHLFTLATVATPPDDLRERAVRLLELCRVKRRRPPRKRVSARRRWVLRHYLANARMYARRMRPLP